MISAYKPTFGVVPICRVLRNHAFEIAPSTYYAFKCRPASARSVSDARLLPIAREFTLITTACMGSGGVARSQAAR